MHTKQALQLSDIRQNGLKKMCIDINKSMKRDTIVPISAFDKLLKSVDKILASCKENAQSQYISSLFWNIIELINNNKRTIRPPVEAKKLTPEAITFRTAILVIHAFSLDLVTARELLEYDNELRKQLEKQDDKTKPILDRGQINRIIMAGEKEYQAAKKLDLYKFSQKTKKQREDKQAHYWNATDVLTTVINLLQTKDTNQNSTN